MASGLATGVQVLANPSGAQGVLLTTGSGVFLSGAGGLIYGGWMAGGGYGVLVVGGPIIIIGGAGIGLGYAAYRYYKSRHTIVIDAITY